MTSDQLDLSSRAPRRAAAGGDVVAESGAPVRRGQHVRLRAIEAQDTDFVHRLAAGGNTSERWRYRGSIPDPRAFARGLRKGALALFVVERNTDSRPIGLVSAYGANHCDGYLDAAVVCEEAVTGTGLDMEALLLLVDHILESWSFRTVYFDAVSFDFERLTSDDRRVLREEARLHDRTFHAGRYWDLVIGSFTRATLNPSVYQPRRF